MRKKCIEPPGKRTHRLTGSQQRVSQRAANQRAAGADRLRGTDRIQAGVDLDQIHGNQVTRLVHALADEVTLAEGQTATHGRACAGRPLGVQGVDVKGQMDGRVVADVSERHVHHLADTVPATTH